MAVKILEVDAVDFQAHLTDRDQTAQDFLKELKTLQQIQSYNAPNVNKIYEVLEVYSQFWIISEYCPGGSVHTLVSLFILSPLSLECTPTSMPLRPMDSVQF